MEGENKLKVYLETSFVSYLTGRATTREPVASWQAASRQWWEAVRPSCDLFVSRYVVMEAEKGNAEQMANEFTLPKTYGILRDAGLKCPVIITPKRYMEDISHDE